MGIELVMDVVVDRRLPPVPCTIHCWLKVMAPIVVVVDERERVLHWLELLAVMKRVARPSRPSPRSPCPGVLSLSHTELHCPL